MTERIEWADYPEQIEKLTKEQKQFLFEHPDRVPSLVWQRFLECKENPRLNNHYEYDARWKQYVTGEVVPIPKMTVCRFGCPHDIEMEGKMVDCEKGKGKQLLKKVDADVSLEKITLEQCKAKEGHFEVVLYGNRSMHIFHGADVLCIDDEHLSIRTFRNGALRSKYFCVEGFTEQSLEYVFEDASSPILAVGTRTCSKGTYVHFLCKNLSVCYFPKHNDKMVANRFYVTDFCYKKMRNKDGTIGTSIINMFQFSKHDGYLLDQQGKVLAVHKDRDECDAIPLLDSLLFQIRPISVRLEDVFKEDYELVLQILREHQEIIEKFANQIYWKKKFDKL